MIPNEFEYKTRPVLRIVFMKSFGQSHELILYHIYNYIYWTVVVRIVVEVPRKRDFFSSHDREFNQ